MTKYSKEFKLNTIKMDLKGGSIYHIAKILIMPNESHKNRKYTPIFKQKIIEYNVQLIIN